MKNMVSFLFIDLMESFQVTKLAECKNDNKTTLVRK